MASLRPEPRSQLQDRNTRKRQSLFKNSLQEAEHADEVDGLEHVNALDMAEPSFVFAQDINQDNIIDEKSVFSRTQLNPVGIAGKPAAIGG